jgi:hypothetical protein
MIKGPGGVAVAGGVREVEVKPEPQKRQRVQEPETVSVHEAQKSLEEIAQRHNDVFSGKRCSPRPCATYNPNKGFRSSFDELLSSLASSLGEILMKRAERSQMVLQKLYELQNESRLYQARLSVLARMKKEAEE